MVNYEPEGKMLKLILYIYYIMLNQKVRCVYIIYIYSYHHMFLKIVEADMNRHMPRHPD